MLVKSLSLAIFIAFITPACGGSASNPADLDNDGILDSEDNCVGIANTDQIDQDNDAIGDECDLDSVKIPQGTGGKSSTGTTRSTGGATSFGGSSAIAGSSSQSAGTTSTNPSSGGSNAFGGSNATGGLEPTAGNSAKAGSSSNAGTTSTGGKTSTGGATSIAGSASVGGKSSTGGSAQTGGTSSIAGSSAIAGSAGTVTINDKDGDGIVDTSDNCPLIANSTQLDVDLDGIGDTCDPTDGRTCPTKISASECDNINWYFCPILPLNLIPKQTLIKGADHPAIYWYSSDGNRYIIPNEDVYNSWFTQGDDCPTIYEISEMDMGRIMPGGNVTIRPGSEMVKITTDQRTYAISCGSVLRWVQTESLASQIYGLSWAKKIRDVPDAFIIDYTIGSAITTASDFNPDMQFITVRNIDDDLACR